MKLTNKQEEAVKIAIERYKNKEPYTIVAGYAGSGKSTLVNFIIEALGIEHDKVAYLAYTGKAANVLRQKGCPNAMTIHKLLYFASKNKDGTFTFKKRPRLDNNYQLLIVDEISMVSNELWEDLLSYKVHIIGLGDPGQLSPPSQNNSLSLLNSPHVFLDQIMRQALDSEIIRLSMWVREGNSLESYKGDNEEVMIIDKKDIVTGMYDWADEIICATNKKREALNKEIRRLKGYPESEIVEGDKVIGLSNHWSFLSEEGDALTNGCIGYIDNYWESKIKYPKFLVNKTLNVLNLNFTTDDGMNTFYDVPIDYRALVTGESSLTNEEEFKIMGYNKKHRDRQYDIPFIFTYGYAITCWKAQGSQWDKVLLYEEGFPFGDDHIRYLYTGITRAVNKCVIVKK